MADTNFSDASKRLTNDKMSRTIKSADLLVEGHLLKWENTVIQISNISMITSVNHIPAFPNWTISAFLLGIILLFVGADRYYDSLTIIQMAGIGALAVGAGYFVQWFATVKEIASHKCLHFILNSRYTYTLEFKDASYRDRVLDVFEDIFRDGTNDGTYYYFDLKHSTISDSRIGGTINH